MCKDSINLQTQIYEQETDKDFINFQTQIYDQEKILFAQTGLEVFQDTDANQKILEWNFVCQLDGNVPGSFGLFNIRGKIRNGTLQFMYNNGLSILIYKICLLKGLIQRRVQICKTEKFQLKILKKEKIKQYGGDNRIRIGKEGRKKWRWKITTFFFLWTG